MKTADKLIAVISSAELATILASLRHWQAMIQRYEDRGQVFYPSHEGFGPFFKDHGPLSLAQIDKLCEHINFSLPYEDPKGRGRETEHRTRGEGVR